jgi:tRNA-dihydrouridine synthase
MKYYFAPMEGITGYLYRRVYQEFFSGVDKFFTPFIVPHTSKNLNSREKKDILPEHNAGICLVPQILTNRAEDFIRVARALSEYGYEEVNLNLGCPSKTVVSKGKGSGFLAFPKKIDEFFYEVFEQLDMKVSVKTRIGMEDPEEFGPLLEIYNRYPIEELIIHPRLQTDYYKNHADWETFRQGLAGSKNPVCYNGDLFTVEDYEKWKREFPQVEAVMLGRGLIANPGLAGMLRDGTTLSKDTFRAFHDRLCEEYTTLKIGDRNVLFKMKELWHYMIYLFPDHKKLEKKIKKAQNLSAYRAAVDCLFAERPLLPDGGYLKNT